MDSLCFHSLLQICMYGILMNLVFRKELQFENLFSLIIQCDIISLKFYPLSKVMNSYMEYIKFGGKVKC